MDREPQRNPAAWTENMADKKTKAELGHQQIVKWLDEHLPYELMMARYTIRRLKEPIFWLDWNAYHSAFVVAAANLAAFLTNSDTRNLKAADIVPNFRSRKGDLSSTFAKMEPQIFHLGKARPSDKGKFDINDAIKVFDWIEAEMSKFVSQLGTWTKHWNQARSIPEYRVMTMYFTGHEPQTASSADPQFVRGEFPNSTSR